MLDRLAWSVIKLSLDTIIIRIVRFYFIGVVYIILNNHFLDNFYPPSGIIFTHHFWHRASLQWLRNMWTTPNASTCEGNVNILAVLTQKYIRPLRQCLHLFLLWRPPPHQTSLVFLHCQLQFEKSSDIALNIKCD